MALPMPIYPMSPFQNIEFLSRNLINQQIAQNIVRNYLRDLNTINFQQQQPVPVHMLQGFAQNTKPRNWMNQANDIQADRVKQERAEVVSIDRRPSWLQKEKRPEIIDLESGED